MENGLWEKSTFFSSSIHSNIGKSTIQHRRNSPSAMRSESVPTLGAGETGELVDGGRVARGEEDGVARLEAELRAHRLGALGAEVLGDRARALGSRPRARRCRPGPAGPRPWPSCPSGRRRRGSRRRGRGWPRCGPWGWRQDAGEHAEAAAAEVRRDVLHLDRVAQVGLVGAVLGDGGAVGDAREGARGHRAILPLTLANSSNTPRMTGSMALNTSSWVTKLISRSSW